MRGIDLTGQKFGRLLVLEKGQSKTSNLSWKCMCDCGKLVEVRGSLLRKVTNPTESCGCIGKKDISGQKFGLMTALYSVGKNKQGKYTWRCVCDCGIEKDALGTDLRQGKIKSCGCFRDNSQTCFKRTHGMSDTKVYGVWRGMIQRCTNPKNNRWKDYGGRGIQVCERWLKFENFYEDMGEPNGLTLDRKDVDGNYSKDNCRWISNLDQQNNRRNNIFVEWEGRTQTIAQWARELEINVDGLRGKLYKGKSFEEAVRELRTRIAIRRNT